MSEQATRLGGVRGFALRSAHFIGLAMVLGFALRTFAPEVHTALCTVL